MFKRALSLVLCAALSLSVLAGCGPKDDTSAGSGSASAAGSVSASTSADASKPVAEDVINFNVLSGPTGIGAAQLMEEGDEDFTLTSEVIAEPKAVVDALVSGSVDIAAVPTNLAATLYNKTKGGVQVLAVNTLGVLYILEKGDTVHSMADLKGKTLYAVGQGANPEYVLNHLLTENGVAPADVDIQFLTAQEITAKMASSESGICMLPVPAATALMMKDQGVREAVSLSEAWDKLDKGPLPQGCVVARTQFIQENPQLVEDFLDEYKDSIKFMKSEDNRAEAAALVAKYGIAPNDKVAAKAIPQAGLTFEDGGDMQDMLVNYYNVLMKADPKSIGGGLPADDFYYGVD